MATTSLSEVNKRADDTVLYSSGNECLAIKPDASLGSLQDALNERLDQAHAVIQMLAVDAVNNAADEDSLSKDIIVNALWAADMRAQIEATMVAEYGMKDDPGQEALEAFASKNASYHVWPYWREYLSSQCLRKVVVPAVQFPFNHGRKTPVDTPPPVD